MGALLHDIGKIGISDVVLQKPGRLTPEEEALIRQHPVIGRKILECVQGFEAYLPVVELHHENWDGSGYPRGLKGEETPRTARIVKVADAYDAMTSDRPYRRGMRHEEAIRILEKHAGTQFDVAAVQAFVTLGDIVQAPGCRRRADPGFAASSGGRHAVGNRVCGAGCRGGELAYDSQNHCLLCGDGRGASGPRKPSRDSNCDPPSAAESVYSHDLTEAPRDGAPVTGGFQALLYPTWKLNSHWADLGCDPGSLAAVFPGRIHEPGLRREDQYSERQHQLLAVLEKRLAGGARRPAHFGLRFVPSALRSGGESADRRSCRLRLLRRRSRHCRAWPARKWMGPSDPSTCAPSSRIPRRRIRAASSIKDQYANWTGGAGYTIRQGFRVGVSAYRGPYLDRHYPYYFPGEARPRDLPATGYGLDVQWGRGPWNVYGELSHFQMTYKAIPTFNLHTGYAEVRRVLHPRWYAAARVGYSRPVGYPGSESYEMAAGFRPTANQVLKFGYTIEHDSGAPGSAGARGHDSVRDQLPGVRFAGSSVRPLPTAQSIPPASSNFRHAAGQVNRSW